MQWDDSANAGFTTGEPWLPVNANHVDINAAAAVADPGSVFHHYRALVRLRHELEVVREGRFELLLADHESLFCYTRTWGDEVLLVVANLSSGDVRLPAGLPDTTDAKLLLGTHEAADPGLLSAWESRVLRL